MRSVTSDIVVIGGSAGAVAVLTKLVEGLPEDFPASIFVTVHVPPGHESALPHILARHTPLRCEPLSTATRIEAGRIYVAPPDHHLVLGDGMVEPTRGPPEHGMRPAIDAMLRSAAVAYGPRVIGVVITGMLSDGVAGLEEVKRCGGTTIVQAPEDAEFAGLPQAAVGRVAPDHVSTGAALAPLLVELVLRPPRPGS